MTGARRRTGTRDGVFQRNGWWWIDYYDADGKRHRKKAAPDYATARMIHRNTMTAIARGEVTGVREEGMRVREFIEKKYWPTVEPTLSKWERLRARVILDKQILPAFGDVKLSKLTREEVERWRAARLAAVAGGTVNKELVRLKHLLNRAVAWRYVRESAAKNVTKVREAPGRVRYLARDEREALIREANPALRLYIVAALQSGARRGELLDLRWKDVDMRACTLTFRHTKNGQSRSVAMTSTMRSLLEALPRSLNPDGKVLPETTAPGLTVAFGRLARRIGVKGVRFHDLRHDAASTLTMAGVPQRAVMEILGHRDPRMTLRYQHLAPGHLTDAMRALDRPRDFDQTTAATGTIWAP
jgi:integrase